MILAAGLGTRLGELGARTPKALIEVGGKTMIEHVAGALIGAGADRIIVNVHHHADAILDFVRDRSGFGVDVVFSHERERPLETGGGLLHARDLFRRDAPFFLHNVDIITGIDLPALYRSHETADTGHAALASLAVQERDSSRALLFDEDGLFGRRDAGAGSETVVRAARGPVRALPFSGVHVISPIVLDRISERGAFSILDMYLRLASEGERIAGVDVGDALWLEIGSPARLAAARAHFED